MASDSRRWLAVVAAGWLGLAAGLVTPAAAEPVAAPGDQTKAARLKLAAKRGEPGQWARAEARLAADGERRYYLGGANVSAPLSIQVIAERTDVPIQVSLHRQSWAVVEAEGTTGAAGLYRFEGRAYGDVGIRLRAAGDRATRATVLVWQGEPVPPPLQAVYAPPDSARVAAALAAGGVATRATSAGATTAATAARGAGAANGADGAAPAAAGGTSPVMLAILGALVVIAGLLAVLVFRRGGAKAATALAALSLALAFAATPGPVQAQAPDPFEVPKELQKPPLDADKMPRGPKPAEPKPKDDAKSRDDAKPADADRRAGRGTDARGSDAPKDPFRPSDAPKDGDANGDADGDGGRDGGGEGSGSYRERIEAAEQNARDLAAQVATNRAELERLRMLLESDRDNETDPDRFPPMPISCRPPRFAGGDGVMTPSQSEAIDAAWDNYEECTQCYRQPLADFERQLELYERLRVLYSDTSKFVTKVIAVGDQAAKPHYLLENAWAAQKTKIRVDFAKTQAAYDAKLEEFNGRLSEILDRIGACETELNDNPMWRRTSGTFFYHATVNAYKRTD